MSDLIERLERAAEGTDALDREIAAACKVPWSADENGQFGGYNILPRRCHFTRSIDAALTLVPEVWQWDVSNSAPAPKTGRAWINNRELQLSGIGGMSKNPKYLGFEYIASTPAIALVLTCLRARASAMGEKG